MPSLLSVHDLIVRRDIGTGTAILNVCPPIPSPKCRPLLVGSVAEFSWAT